MRPEFAVQQEYDEFLGKWEIKVFEDGEMVFKGYRKHKIKDTIEFLNQVDLLRNG